MERGLFAEGTVLYCRLEVGGWRPEEWSGISGKRFGECNLIGRALLPCSNAHTNLRFGGGKGLGDSAEPMYWDV